MPAELTLRERNTWPRVPAGLAQVSLNPLWLVLTSSIWIAAVPNTALWLALGQSSDAAGGVRLMVILFILVVSLGVMLLAPLAYARAVRLPVAVLLVLASLLHHFMTAYGVVIDPSMVANAAQTDWRESVDLVSGRMLLHLLVLGVLPALVVVWMPLEQRSFGRQTALNMGAMMLALVVALGAVLGGFQTFAARMRNEPALRYLINPYNGLWGALVVTQRARAQAGQGLEAVGADARLARRLPAVTGAASHSPPLIVLVVGETARSTHFNVNGYGRDTTPHLARWAREPGFASFTQAESCGTNTATSLPCMFSHRGMADWPPPKGPEENLLDILQRAGYAVMWVDNQSGCKGVCARVPSHATREADIRGLCGPDTDGCPDAAILPGLDERIAALDKDRLRNGLVLVLHQMGSHGPAYAARSPAAHKRFAPECRTPNLAACDRQALINTYDNSIVYTDFFLDSVRNWAKANARWSSVALLYVADHGESLGEKGLYLHGLPRAIAPREQVHVPWLHWLSPGFLAANGLDANCLRARRQEPITHDHYFHTVLGLAEVQTSVYQRTLDAYAPCRQDTRS